MSAASRASVGPIAIVGASLAGLSAARGLREAGHHGDIVVFGDEVHLPYDRPPLSKEVLRTGWDLDRIGLLREGEEGQFQWRLGVSVEAMDADALRLRVDGEWTDSFSGGIVVATGARPRVLPRSEAPGVHVVRTWEDGSALAGELASGHRRVVIVGGGFVGAEVAATAAAAGCDVTMIEVDETPLSPAIGVAAASAVVAEHRTHGVRIIAPASVSELVIDDGRCAGVRLTDGRVVPADVTVVGIGAVPNTEWLEGSGLKIDDGVVCDPTLSAAPFVVAAGDVARWHNSSTGLDRRVEHWDNAKRQGAHAARRLLAEHRQGPIEPFVTVPWVWSDQYAMKLQLAGVTRDPDEVVIAHGSIEEGRFVALYRRGDHLAGAFCLSRVKPFMRYRELLSRHATWAEALDLAAST